MGSGRAITFYWAFGRLNGRVDGRVRRAGLHLRCSHRNDHQTKGCILWRTKGCRVLHAPHPGRTRASLSARALNSQCLQCHCPKLGLAGNPGSLPLLQRLLSIMASRSIKNTKLPGSTRIGQNTTIRDYQTVMTREQVQGLHPAKLSPAEHHCRRWGGGTVQARQ